MRQKQKWMGFVICLALVMYIQAFFVQPIYAGVDEVHTDGQNIHETEPSDGKGDSVGGGGEDLPWWKKAWNAIKDVGSDGLKLIDDIGSSIGEQWNEFLDWAGEAWDGANDWISEVGSDIGDWLSDAGDAIGQFFSDAWDWVKENEWFQTIVAAIVATGVIVGGIFLVVGSLPALLVIGVIGGLALGAGFLYQWLAGDNYNFFGAFGAALGGGLLGYIGMTTGAFAAGLAWLRHTAGPAVWSWIRGTAVPWVVGRGQAAWGWMRTVAFPWIRGKAVAGWRWFKGLPAWGQIRAGYTSSGSFLKLLQVMGKGAGVSGTASMLVNFVTQLFDDDPFSVKSLVISTVLGSITGGLAAPIIIPGLVMSGSLITTLSIVSGIENWLSGGLEKGEWLSWQNFVSGTLTSFVSIAAISKLTGLIKQPIFSEIGTKGAEEPVKNFIDDILGGNESNKTNTPADKPAESIDKPTQEPNQNTPEEPSDKPIDSQKDNTIQEPKSPQEPVQNNVNNQRTGGGLHPQALQQ